MSTAVASQPSGPSSSSSSAPKGTPAPADINQQYSKFKNDLQALAQKIGELESDVDEHTIVLQTLQPYVKSDPQRKAFRLIGGILVERRVVDVVPDLEGVIQGIKGTLDKLVQQYKSTEDDFLAFQKKHNIQVVTRQ